MIQVALSNAKELDGPAGRRRVPDVLARTGRVAIAMAVDSAADRFPRATSAPTRPTRRRCCARWASRTLDELVAETVPADIRFAGALDLPAPVDEAAVLGELRALAAKNQVFKSFIGMGYSDCITPPVIQRNILENPGWYTQYTPYQAEIAQGRLEALLNFQTMVDGPDRAADRERVAARRRRPPPPRRCTCCTRCRRASDDERRHVLRRPTTCHPQTIDVVRTRARAAGHRGAWSATTATFDFGASSVFGALRAVPGDRRRGASTTARSVERAHAAGALVAWRPICWRSTLLTPPGELGADVAVGSAQRFGVPLGYGGPHAAFFATQGRVHAQAAGPHHRRLRGRARASRALRMALQTREQHIRREKATSNICTAQVLLAVIAEHVRRLSRAARARARSPSACTA